MLHNQPFLELVQSAFFEASNPKRQQAELALLNMKDQQLDEFIRHCGDGLANLGLPSQIRQACSTLLKRCLSLTSDQQGGQVVWQLVSIPLRMQIKQQCLGQLIDADYEIRRSAANTISEICAIELPRSEWPDLIPNLVTNTKANDLSIRVSAVMTLGYICEALKNNMHSGIKQQDAQTILLGICQGMDKNEQNMDVKLTAIKALQDSLYFMNEQFQQIEIRNYVKNIILENAMSTVPQVKIKSLQCLIDFTKQLFIYIPAYLQDIFNTTSTSFEGEESIAIPAIEVWTTLGNEIKELKDNRNTQQQQFDQTSSQCIQFLTINYQSFIIPFMKNLLINSNEDEDDDQSGLSIQQSSYKALAIILELVGKQTHEQVTTFISNTIKSTEWAHRKAAVLAYGALAEGQESDAVKSLLFTGISVVISLLQDSSSRVKFATGSSLARVAEFYPECFLVHAQAVNLLQQLLAALNAKTNLILNIVWTLVYITENLHRFPQSPIIAEKLLILQHLASTSVRQDIKSNQVNLIDTAFMGILNVMYLVNDPSDCKAFLNDFVTQVRQADSMPDEKKTHLQSGLFSAMHGCLVRMLPDSLSEQETVMIFQVLGNTGPQVKSDQFYVIAGLATSMKKRFSKYAEYCIGQLNQPLLETQDIDTFKSALFCLSDIARALEDEFAQYLQILTYLIGLIQTPQFNRDLKIQVYNAIADIILGTKAQAISYIPQLKNILNYGFQACVEMANSDDVNQLDYAERLKECMVQFYTCLLHAYCESTSPFVPLADTIQWLFHFCEKTCDKKLKPTLEFARSTLNVIFDTANFYNNSTTYKSIVQQFVTGPFVIDLVKTLNKYKHEKEYQDCVLYAQELLKDYYNYHLPLDN